MPYVLQNDEYISIVFYVLHKNYMDQKSSECRHVWLNEAYFTRKMPILTIFAIQAQTRVRKWSFATYTSTDFQSFSYLCYLGLPALYMYSPVDSEDVDFYSPPLIIPYSYTHNIMLVWLTLTKWSWLWWSGLLSLTNSSILYLPMNLIKRN